MTSKQTFECFQCKNNGFPAVMIYLNGKDEKGRAIKIEQDGVTSHVHKTRLAPSEQQQHIEMQAQTATANGIGDVLLQVKLLQQKMDKIISLLESQKKEEESTNK